MLCLPDIVFHLKERENGDMEIERGSKANQYGVIFLRLIND